MGILALLYRHWRILALLACVLGLFWLGYHTKAKIDAREAERAALERQVAEQAVQLQVTRKIIADQRASAEAAQAARERNDRIIPQTRRDTQGRVDRAPTASPAVELQDDAAAIDAYRAAADRLRGKSAG
jgi:hypothetical protein